MWFNKNDIKIDLTDIIDINNIKGYILPHASTKYTKHVLSQTLRFKPNNYFKNIFIIYYSAYNKENVFGKYFHEYYVIWKTMEYVCNHIWNYPNKNFISLNLRHSSKVPKYNIKDTLIIVSADFSHFISLQDAIHLENCAAHSILNRKLFNKCNNVIDHIDSFKLLYKIISKKWFLQWVGRSRSPGIRGVGYLSFLIRTHPYPSKKKPNGMSITLYDNTMKPKHQIDKWYNKTNQWSLKKEKEIINNVIHNIKNYSVTYLYEDSRDFIRGWHAIYDKKFILPSFFLENTFDNLNIINKKNKEWKTNLNIKKNFNKYKKYYITNKFIYIV